MNISEVAKEFDLTPDTLRYYEREGLIPEVDRTSGGIRSYTEEDCRWISFIKCMRGAGMPIDKLNEYVKLFTEGEHTAPRRKELLIEQRNAIALKIKEMNETLKRLDKKIDGYEKMMMPIENELRRK